MILAAIVIARNPAQYGFDFEPDAVAVYEKVTLTKPVDLRRIAEWAETTIDEIQTLNPELRRWTTPVRDKQYELKVPIGQSRSGQRPAGRSGGVGTGLAQLVHRQEGRYAGADRQEAEGQPDRSGRSELPVVQGARIDRTEADGAARSDGADGGASDRCAGARSKAPAENARGRRGAAGRSAKTVRRRLRADATRVKVIYAVKRGDTLVLDRPALQDDGRRRFGPGIPDSRRPDRRRPAADGLPIAG